MIPAAHRLFPAADFAQTSRHLISAGQMRIAFGSPLAGQGQQFSDHLILFGQAREVRILGRTGGECMKSASTCLYHRSARRLFLIADNSSCHRGRHAATLDKNDKGRRELAERRMTKEPRRWD
jgi:hypothetical protein